MFKLTALLAMAVCLGVLLESEAQVINVSGARSKDTPHELAARVSFNVAPSAGWVYIIDRDSDLRWDQSGCRPGRNPRNPRIQLKLKLGSECSHEVYAVTLSNGQVSACIERFLPLTIRPDEASHRFEAWFTNDESIAGNDEDVGDLRRALRESSASASSITSLYPFCLTYGDDTNECYCAYSKKPLVMTDSDGKWPSRGESEGDFFKRLSPRGDSGTVLYVVDLDYSETAGNGGCAAQDRPAGKIVSVITNVGQTGCPEGSTAVSLDGDLPACRVDSFPYSVPAVSSGEEKHEWKVYGLGYRVPSAEGSVADLVAALDQRSALSTSLCFRENEEEADRSDCACAAPPPPVPKISVSYVSENSRPQDIVRSLSFDRVPTSGFVYVIDRDNDARRGYAGCRTKASPTQPKVILKLEVGSSQCAFSFSLVTLPNSDVPACIISFSSPQLDAEDASHRFEVWYTSDASIAQSDSDVLSTLLPALQNAEKATPSAASVATYCLTLGNDSNQCYCSWAGAPRLLRFPVNKFPKKGDPSDKFFQQFLSTGDLGGVMYFVDTDYDESAENRGCGDNKNPSGKVAAVLTKVGRIRRCPPGSVKVPLNFGFSGCLQDSVEFYSPVVESGDVGREWRVYGLGYRVIDAESSASSLVAALEKRGASYLTLCFKENTAEAQVGACSC